MRPDGVRGYTTPGERKRRSFTTGALCADANPPIGWQPPPYPVAYCNSLFGSTVRE